MVSTITHDFLRFLTMDDARFLRGVLTYLDVRDSNSLVLSHDSLEDFLGEDSSNPTFWMIQQREAMELSLCRILRRDFHISLDDLHHLMCPPAGSIVLAGSVPLQAITTSTFGKDGHVSDLDLYLSKTHVYETVIKWFGKKMQALGYQKKHSVDQPVLYDFVHLIRSVHTWKYHASDASVQLIVVGGNVYQAIEHYDFSILKNVYTLHLEAPTRGEFRKATVIRDWPAITIILDLESIIERKCSYNHGISLQMEAVYYIMSGIEPPGALIRELERTGYTVSPPSQSFLEKSIEYRKQFFEHTMGRVCNRIAKYSSRGYTLSCDFHLEKMKQIEAFLTLETEVTSVVQPAKKKKLY